MRRTAAIAIGLLLLAGVLAPTAGAQGSAVPDQYIEGVPGPGGEKPSRDLGPGGSGGGSDLPPGEAAALERQGAEGAAAARVAEATGPTIDSTSGPSESTDEGLGVGLPIILVLVLAAAVAVAFTRWRRESPPSAA